MFSFSKDKNTLFMEKQPFLSENQLSFFQKKSKSKNYFVVLL
jgi:hypothetical protein